MKKLIVCFAVLMICNLSFGQLRKPKHWIFVWDVTLSMCGYVNPSNDNTDLPLFQMAAHSDYITPQKYIDKNNNARYEAKNDIYDEVVKILIDRINTIDEDDLGEITIIPFNDDVINTFTRPATSKGKKEICNYIQNFSTLKLSNTNIKKPLEMAMNFSQDGKRNIIMLLTDGEQSKIYNRQEFYDKLEEFCRISEPNDAYLFYMMLTETARDKEILPYLESCNRIKVIQPDEKELRFPVNVQFSGSMVYNIQDNDGKEVIFEINVDTDGDLPRGFAFQTICDDECFGVDTESKQLVNGKLNLKVRLKKSRQEVEHELGGVNTKKLNVYIQAVEEDPYVVLLDDVCVLEVVNKPERKMIIRTSAKK